jgi:nitroreductase
MDIIEVINTRATVREFSDEKIKENDLKTILEAAIRAPNAGGNEQWFFIIVENKEKLEELRNLIIQAQRLYYTEMMKIPLSKEQLEKWEGRVKEGLYKAPLYIAAFKDLRVRYYKNNEIEERWAEQSVCAAIENMILTAHSLNIGSCWFGVPLLIEDKFYEFFNVKKEELKLVAIIAFGYPKQKPMPRKRKKKIEDVAIRI